MASTVRSLQCTHPGCLAIAPDGPLCAQHLLLWRRGMGLCPNCGGARERRPVTNELTGRQLRRGPRRLHVWQQVCTQCGRGQRPYTEKEDPA